MSDLISRQAAIDELTDYCENKCVNREDAWCSGCHYGISEYVLKALPSAQPEIVRCSDCRYYGDEDEYEHWCNGWGLACKIDNTFRLLQSWKGERMRIKLDDGAFLPERAHELDAGYDLRTPVAFTLPPADEMGDGCRVINTGVHVAIPGGYAGIIKSKSGLNFNHGITSDGLVDSGYVGAVHVKLYNHGSQWMPFNVGDKISQLVIVPIITPDLEVVDELEETERGENGFGSTGK